MGPADHPAARPPGRRDPARPHVRDRFGGRAGQRADRWFHVQGQADADPRRVPAGLPYEPASPTKVITEVDAARFVADFVEVLTR